MVEIVGAIWIASGFGFWVGAIIHNGFPRAWRSSARDTGWGEALVYLLIALIGGPIFWIAAAVHAARART
jgi:hypothetical protein